MPKSKKFIDKKNAVSFQLVHRSQQDPLIVDDEAPQMVLVEKPNLNQERRTERIEEQHKYGIYFNDDTNYLQHLKDRNDHQMEWPEHVEVELDERREKQIKFQLPSQVFPSDKEEMEGMLSKAAPVKGLQLDLDPDIVAAMDDDFDYTNPDNMLEDNFIELADGVASDEEIDEDFMIREEDEDVDSEDLDEVNSMKSFEQEETKSRFTNYSMSSSVIHRNENLTLLDQRFEKDYENFDEEKIGGLDGEEIEGFIEHNSNVLLKMADDFEKEHRNEQLDEHSNGGDDKLKTKIIQLVNNQNDDEFVYIEVPEKEKYDCQSILSTYSNIYNHPKTITLPKTTKIKTHKSTGIPLNVLDENKLTRKNLEQINVNYDSNPNGTKSIGVHSIISRVSELSIRPKDETVDEKRERKQKFKEYKRERRIEKKANKEAFKEEAKRQVKNTINNLYNKKIIQ